MKIPAGLEMIVGERVRLMKTDDPYTALRSGDEGVVAEIRPDAVHEGQWVIDIEWDSGSTLSMLTAAGDAIELAESS